MATQTEKVSAGLSDSIIEVSGDIGGVQGAVHLGRPYQGAVGCSTEPINRPPPRVSTRQQAELGVSDDVHRVVQTERDKVCDGKNTQGVVYAVGDINSTARGSGARANGGKTRLDLIPLHLLKDGADVFEYGINKYAEWNWAKGMEWSIPYQCLLRHLAAWWSGEDLDKESGLPHLGHAMANLIMLEHYAKGYKEGDNRPTLYFGGEQNK